jgi:hypothetical protein
MEVTKPAKDNNKDLVEPSAGFGPATITLPKYKDFLDKKYFNKQYVKLMYNYAIKYRDYLDNPQLFHGLTSSQKHNILRGIICLSKYLGCYEEFKAKLKNCGIKWDNGDTSFKGFLSIFSKKHDTVPDYIKEIWPQITASEKVYVKFLSLTGLRVSEAIAAFNLIITLNSKGRLDDYYNREMKVLEHFRHQYLFIRKTKNAYISFVSPALIEEISRCEPVTYDKIVCRLQRKNSKLRLKELRSFNNTFLRKNDIISELIDILAGRVPKSVFVRHYLAEDMLKFSKQVLMIQEGLMNALFKT